MPSAGFSQLFQRGLTEAVGEVGEAVTLIRRAAGAYDPASGAAAVTETTVAFSGIVSGWRQEVKPDGALNRWREVLVPVGALPAGTRVQTGDCLVFAGAHWTVFELSTFAAGLAQDCRVRLT